MYRGRFARDGFEHGEVVAVDEPELARRGGQLTVRFRVRYDDGDVRSHMLEEDHIEVETKRPPMPLILALDGGHAASCSSSAALSSVRHTAAAAKVKGAVHRSAASAGHEAAPHERLPKRRLAQEAEDGALEHTLPEVGVRVRARYLASQPKAKRRKKGGANLWYDGVVTHVDESAGTFGVLYDDGEEEAGVLAEYLVVLGSDGEEDAAPGATHEGEVGKTEEAQQGKEAQVDDLAKISPKPNSLRSDTLAALISGVNARSDVVDYVWEHGVASTRGNDDKTILRADVTTLLGREAKAHFPLWMQDGSSYFLSEHGMRVQQAGTQP